MVGDFRANRVLNSAVCDPCILDPDFPFEQFVIHFISQGSVVHGTAWIAQGRESKGTVILSSQLYGGDRLESAIIPLMSAGINVVTFHPRGMWDNRHVYTLTGAVDDVLAAAAFIRATHNDDIRTLQDKVWRTDPTRIAVMGLSGGGGNVSLAACSEDPLIQSVIAVAPVSMAAARNPKEIELAKDHFARVKAMSAGRVDVEATLMAMTAADAARMNPFLQATRLVEKNVLIVGALRDAVAPLETCHKPIVAALRGAGVKALDEAILETDHSFLTKRIALSQLVIEWLQQRCGF